MSFPSTTILPSMQPCWRRRLVSARVSTPARQGMPSSCSQCGRLFCAWAWVHFGGAVEIAEQAAARHELDVLQHSRRKRFYEVVALVRGLRNLHHDEADAARLAELAHALNQRCGEAGFIRRMSRFGRHRVFE